MKLRWSWFGFGHKKQSGYLISLISVFSAISELSSYQLSAISYLQQLSVQMAYPFAYFFGVSMQELPHVTEVAVEAN